MSVESYIKENVTLLNGKVHIAPEIPEKKLNNAISSIANEVDPDYILAIVDCSIFGSGKDGLVFLGDAVYVRGTMEKPKVFKYETMVSAEYKLTETQKDNGKVVKKEEAILYFQEDQQETITSNLNGINYEGIVQIINGILEESGEEKEYVSTTQTLPLAEMDENIKLTYIKLVCNYAFSNDDIIDANEYAEIVSLITRVELASEKRLELRNYMYSTSDIEGNEALIQYIMKHVPQGSFDIVKKSLIKDVLFIFRLNHDTEEWSQDAFIVELQKKLQIDDDQIELILTAIKHDEDILKERKSDSEIKKTMKELAAKAGAVGVPMAAIYFTGSVMGLGATGITSGLATLGMGGMLGLSSMATGIGAAVLIGVGAYKGIKKVTGISELENNKQREIMLQSIIKNAQNSLNYLIEDVNQISQQLMEEVKKGQGTSMKVEKLSALLAKLSRGAQATTEKISHAEKESVIAKLPQKVNLSRIQELTNQATREKLRTFILSCYTESEEVKEDGTIQTILRLNNQLPLLTLERLYAVLENIGYTNVKDASIASAKGAAKNLFNNFRG
ncbi:hypothetical protein [Aquibacillus rhizosphaerae]|uniref:ENT domain-containing protein n=1 Tax=Aquibacillus rhizosphaerae TaxID=3051431 RepID=A0ABT7L5F8_9BACI|nr:hypothetical protein [Aquibacillus sp. LR5S19]MDL4839811.1 hypothetical protein [Aquibacillus sp. LR5S19]